MRPTRAVRATPARGARALATILTATVVAVVGGCNDDAATPDRAPGSTAPGRPAGIGEGEGRLRVLAMQGYAENGRTDPDVDWVTDFELQTGCQVSTVEMSADDVPLDTIVSAEWDVASAPGHLVRGLAADGRIAPIDVDLLPNYRPVFPYLARQPWNRASGDVYAVPIGWTADRLRSHTTALTPPEDWGAMYDPATPVPGRIAVRDDPLTLADAALRLRAERPELGIDDPFALDDTQFAATVELAARQSPLVGLTWQTALEADEALRMGSVALTAAPVPLGVRGPASVPSGDEDPVVSIAVPGGTARIDGWMVAAGTPNPNCAAMWLDWTLDADTNAQVAERNGLAPASREACELTIDPEYCTVTSADDTAFAEQLVFRTTPLGECIDGRTNVSCVPRAEWDRAWAEIVAD